MGTFLRYFRDRYLSVPFWLRWACCFYVLHLKLLNPNSASISQSTYYKTPIRIYCRGLDSLLWVNIPSRIVLGESIKAPDIALYIRAVVTALAFHQCVPGSIPGPGRRHMWVEFVVGSLLCSERFLSGFSGFPPSSKINILNSNSIGNSRATGLLCDCYVLPSLNKVNLFIFYIPAVQTNLN